MFLFSLSYGRPYSVKSVWTLRPFRREALYVISGKASWESL